MSRHHCAQALYLSWVRTRHGQCEGVSSSFVHRKHTKRSCDEAMNRSHEFIVVIAFTDPTPRRPLLPRTDKAEPFLVALALLPDSPWTLKSVSEDNVSAHFLLVLLLFRSQQKLEQGNRASEVSKAIFKVFFRLAGVPLQNLVMKFFPCNFSSFAVQGHGNLGLKFLLKFFFCSECPSKRRPKTSWKTSRQAARKTSPRTAPLQNGNFAQNFPLQKPIANFRVRKISPKFSCIKFFQIRDVPTQIPGHPGHSLSKTTEKGHLHRVFVRDIPTSGSRMSQEYPARKLSVWAAFSDPIFRSETLLPLRPLPEKKKTPEEMRGKKQLQLSLVRCQISRSTLQEGVASRRCVPLGTKTLPN